MSAIAWQEAVDAYAELAQVLRRCAAVQTDALSTQQRLWILEQVETARRMLPALEHGSINGLAEQASRAELGGRLSHALADRLRIMRTEASRRVGEAADLAPRRTFTGQPLPPRRLPQLSPTSGAAFRGACAGDPRLSASTSRLGRRSDASAPKPISLGGRLSSAQKRFFGSLST